MPGSINMDLSDLAAFADLSVPIEPTSRPPTMPSSTNRNVAGTSGLHKNAKGKEKDVLPAATTSLLNEINRIGRANNNGAVVQRESSMPGTVALPASSTNGLVNNALPNNNIAVATRESSVPGAVALPGNAMNGVLNDTSANNIVAVASQGSNVPGSVVLPESATNDASIDELNIVGRIGDASVGNAVGSRHTGAIRKQSTVNRVDNEAHHAHVPSRNNVADERQRGQMALNNWNAAIEAEENDHARPKSNIAPNIVSNRLEEITRQLELLESEEKLLEMQRRIEKMRNERDAGLGYLAIQYQRRRVRPNDVEYMVTPFTGVGEYDIDKWFVDFERVLRSLNGNEDDHYLMARHMIRDEAKDFLQGEETMDYKQLRDAMVERYQRQISPMAVYMRLQRRIRRSDETILSYVTCMQKIARQAHVLEYELVHLIIAGLRDESGYIAVLASAQTIAELIKLLPVYETSLAFAKISASTRSNNSQGAPARRASAPVGNKKPSIRPGDITKAKGAVIKRDKNGDYVYCYNCGKHGHYSSDCDQPRRDERICFHCREKGHLSNNCPKNRAVAAAANEDILQDDPNTTEDEAIARAMNHDQNVSISFELNATQFTRAKIVRSLLDTGSTISFVARSLLPEHHPFGELKKTAYCGIGRASILTFGTVKCYIKLHHRIKLLSLLVVPDDTFPIKLLLGRDALNKFEIGLFDQNLVKSLNKNIFAINKIKIVPIEKLNKLNVKLEPPCTIDSSPSNISCAPDHIANKIAPIENVSNQEEPIDNEIAFDHSILTNNDITEPAIDFSIEHDCDLNQIELDSDSKYNIGNDLTLELKQCVEDCIRHYYEQVDPLLVRPIDYEMVIKLETDEAIHCPPRRLSHTEREEVRRQVNELLEKKVIRPSSSPYASAIVIVRKKNGELRICIDYRPLNAVTVRDNYPLPLIEDCLEYLNRKKIFTVLDLKSGFHQVKVAKDSVKYTSFVTPDGQYEY